MKLLEPDNVFHVPISKVELRRLLRTYHPLEAPPPKGTKTLSFQHDFASAFVVPDFIIHSKRLNQFMAFRSEDGVAVWTVSKLSEKREWTLIPPALVRLGYPDIFIYVDKSPENINLIADSQRICRPEVIIQCIIRKEWSEKEAKEKAKFYNLTLKPKIGTFIISKEPIEEKMEDVIQMLSVSLTVLKHRHKHLTFNLVKVSVETVKEKAYSVDLQLKIAGGCRRTARTSSTTLNTLKVVEGDQAYAWINPAYIRTKALSP